MEDWKAETIASYDRHTALFEKRFEFHFRRVVTEEADFFRCRLPGCRILDLGCGPGIHAAYFRDKGCNVLCTDLSTAMVEACRKLGLSAVVLDMEAAYFQPNTFDGVWAYASLLHLPKDRIPAVINQLHRCLKKDGVLAMSFKLGSTQGYEEHEDFPGPRRWFSRVTQEEVTDWCKDGFEPLRCTTFKASERSTFINLMFIRT